MLRRPVNLRRIATLFVVFKRRQLDFFEGGHDALITSASCRSKISLRSIFHMCMHASAFRPMIKLISPPPLLIRSLSDGFSSSCSTKWNVSISKRYVCPGLSGHWCPDSGLNDRKQAAAQCGFILSFPSCFVTFWAAPLETRRCSPWSPGMGREPGPPCSVLYTTPTRTLAPAWLSSG